MPAATFPISTTIFSVFRPKNFRPNDHLFLLFLPYLTILYQQISLTLALKYITSSDHFSLYSVLLLFGCLSCVQLFCGSMDCSLPDSSVHGLSQARILEGVANFLFQGIFLTLGSNPSLLHWQADSLPLSHQGSPPKSLYVKYL